MTDTFQQKITDLTPEQRELLALRLRKTADEPLPLSFTQEQLWFLDRLEPGTPAYNVPFALRLAGALDVTALGQALDAIVDRHDPLRTVFIERDGELRQRVTSSWHVPLPVVDLRSLPPEARQHAAGRESAEHAATSFSLRTGPLFAVRLLVLADEDHLLVVTA